MQIEFTPQRNDTHANYEFANDLVTITYGETIEVYDFTDMPDGEIKGVDRGALPVLLVPEARRVNGELFVTLVITHGKSDKMPQEVLFPVNPYTVAAAEALLIARNEALIEPPDDEDVFVPPRPEF
jgi:hypothetical protein